MLEYLYCPLFEKRLQVEEIRIVFAAVLYRTLEGGRDGGRYVPLKSGICAPKCHAIHFKLAGIDGDRARKGYDHMLLICRRSKSSPIFKTVPT